jgi:hypothetical protein
MKRLSTIVVMIGSSVIAAEQRPTSDRPGWLATNELLRCSMYQQATYGPNRTSGLLAAYFVRDFDPVTPIGENRFVFYITNHFSHLKSAPVVRVNNKGPAVRLQLKEDSYESTESQARDFRVALENRGSIVVSIDDESFGKAEVTFDALGFSVANDMFGACAAAMQKVYE